MANITKLNETYDFIATLPLAEPGIIESELTGNMWGQWTYGEYTACGTVACFAGWRCVQDGMPLENFKFVWDICDLATRSFGLTEDQAFMLFEPKRTLPELRALIDALADAPDAGLSELHDVLYGAI